MEAIVSFKVAKMARLAGFDEPVNGKYVKGVYERNKLGYSYNHNGGEISPNYISAPTQAHLAQWIRKHHDWFIDVRANKRAFRQEENEEMGVRKWELYYFVTVFEMHKNQPDIGYTRTTLNSNVEYIEFEHAEEAGILFALNEVRARQIHEEKLKEENEKASKNSKGKE